MITLDEHINAHSIDVKKIDNYNRKNFIKRYNEILQIIAFSIINNPEHRLHVKEIKKFIMGKFILSEVATRRYLMAFESSDAFKIVDEYYMLPENVELKVDG